MSRKVIFDTDIGIDDAMALLFLHYSPEVSLEAICTVAGNASITDVTRNALYMCERFSIDAPVFEGAVGSIGVALTTGYPDFVHGANGLGNIDTPVTSRRAEDLAAAAAIVDLARKYPGEISIVAVGRLSNIANALELCPELPTLIDELIVMGGVFMRNNNTGNVSPVAEANIAGDPEAADAVFTSGLETTIVGLDVTHATTMDESFIDQLKESAGDAGQCIYDITRYYFDFYEEIAGERNCPIHDSSAVACLIAPEHYTMVSGPVRVVTDGIAMGQTIFGANADAYAIDAWNLQPDCSICVDVDAEAVKSLYLDTLALAANN